MESDPIAYGLPHRAPFIFVNEVRAIVPGQSALCAKRFPANEPFFQGHFPGDPLVPGVILAEALAQTAGIACGQPGKSFRLSAIKLMKFLRPVRPEAEVLLSAEKSGGMGALVQFQVVATVEGETAAEGIIILNEVERGAGAQVL
jgi:3-hydroxyacyl-[acyl-carrier-protein] dehydratase